MKSSVLIPSPPRSLAYIIDPTIENEGKLASARQNGAIVSALLIPGDTVTAIIFDAFFCEVAAASFPLTTGTALAPTGRASRTLWRCRMNRIERKDRSPSSLHIEVVASGW